MKLVHLSSGRSLRNIGDDIVKYVFQLKKEREQLNITALSFFDEVKTELGKDLTTCTFSHFLAGSIREGYAISFLQRKKIPKQFNGLCSDFDVMISCDSYQASFSQKGNTHIKELGNVEQFDETALLPVYCQLYFQDLNKKILLDAHDLLKKLEKAVDSSSIVDLGIGFMDSLNIITHLKGPSLRITIGPLGNVVFEGDITICIKCEEWPPLSNWPTRTGRSWPSENEVQRISSNGFHLVALPLNSNNNGKYTWRYSFSMAEVELSELVPATAHKCFLALKLIHKDHLKPILPELSSYHIKTIFLNTLEKTEDPECFWVDENIDNCLHTLLQELYHCLETKHCRHYWLDGVNLFCEIPEKKRKYLSTLAKKVTKITRDPIKYVEDIGLFGYIKNKVKKIGFMKIVILCFLYFLFA